MFKPAYFAIAIIAAGLFSTALTAQEYRYPSTTTAQNAAPTSPPAAAPASAPVTTPSAAPAAPACNNCGTVDTIRVTEKAGEGSALGMIAGGVLGGLLGNQIGQGRGNTAATIVGAAGGAYAGNQVEKNMKKTAQYEVNVRMDDGSMRSISYDVEPGFRSGDKVRFVDGRLTRN